MLYSQKHNAVIYRGVDAVELQRRIGTGWLVDADTLAVPYDVVPMQLARWAGLPAYSPIEHAYDWPIRPGLAPMAHQKKMAGFMTLHPRCFNLSDMRTGKTLASLWAYDFLRERGLVHKALVVAKLSTLERVWSRELFTHFLGRLEGVVLYGDREARLKALDREADVYIINYDGLAVGASRGPRGLSLGPVAERIRARQDIDCVIIDESAALRNSSTRRWKIMRQVVHDKPYVWQMTGTPTPNAPTDAHAQKRLVFPTVENFVSFRAKTMIQINGFKWVPKHDAANMVAGFMQPAIRFERRDCMDLPDIVYDPPMLVDLTDEQKMLIDRMRATLQIEMASGAKVTAVNEAALRIKFLQIVQGAVYDQSHVAHPIDCAPRIEALLDVIEEAGGKVLVFAPLTSVVHMVHKRLTDAQIPAVTVTGATSGGERNHIFGDFDRSDGIRVIVADPGTVAHGLDLSAANTIVWYGPTDRVEDYVQANQRIAGPNQRRGMLVVRLAATAIEREIYKRLDAKQSLQGVILDLVKTGCN